MADKHSICPDGHVHIDMKTSRGVLSIIFEDIDSYRVFVNECQEYLAEIETKVPEIFYERGR